MCLNWSNHRSSKLVRGGGGGCPREGMGTPVVYMGKGDQQERLDGVEEGMAAE